MVGKSAGGSHSSAVPTIRELLNEYRDRTGDSYDDMARRVDDAIGKQRLQQLATASPKRLPYEPKTIRALSQLLGVDTATVVLAFAADLGLPVERAGPALAHLLPQGTADLTRDDMDAVLHVVRQMVAVRQAATKADPAPVRELHPPKPDLSKVAARRGESEGRRARKKQDEDSERGDL